tara:strand:- start:160 stop:636 length:477 start_codon:yes stop_codon:yes gene_type:complete
MRSRVVSYRRSSAADSSELVSLIGEMHEETVWGGDSSFDYVPKKMADRLSGFIDNQPESFADIAVVDGKIVGVLLGDYSGMMFGNGRQAREKLVYVDRSFRGGMIGPRLMKRFVSWAHTISADEIVGGANAGIDPERTARLWSKFGLEPFGYTVRARI